MARVNNLTNFLTDISSAIKQKTGDNTPIPASDFDTEILSIETGGNYQSKTLNVTQNGNYNLLPDQEFDAISNVNISVSVSPILQNKTVTENGSYTADQNYDGLGTVIVNVVDPEYATNLALSQQIMGGRAPYTELTYIQSLGTQWVDTLVTGTGYTKIDVKFDSSNYNASSEHCVLGSRIYSDTSMFILGFYSRGWYGYNSSQGSPMRLTGGIYEVRLDKGKFYWFNTTTGDWDLKNTYTIGTFRTPSNMILFGERRSNTVTQLSSIKLYYCKIYENGTLVRDFIPVKRNSDNEICLYDRVSGTFFTNAGTGQFVAGPEVN